MDKIIYLNKTNYFNVINKIITAIDKNLVVIIPTDTIYGFFAPYDNKLLEEKIRKIKVRDEKPFIILVNSFEMLENYSLTYIDENIKKLMPAPLTIIVESKFSKLSDKSLAIRFPQNNFIIDLINNIKKPCISTSANISGHPIPETKEELIKQFKNSVDLIVIDENYEKIPSTILDIRTKPYKIIREGKIKIPVGLLNLK